MILTEVVWRSQRGEDAGEELQTDLDLCTVTVPAGTWLRVSPDIFQTGKTIHEIRGRSDRLTEQTCVDVHALPGCSVASHQRRASSCAAPSRPTCQCGQKHQHQVPNPDRYCDHIRKPLTWLSSECHNWNQTAEKCQRVLEADAKKPQLT